MKKQEQIDTLKTLNHRNAVALRYLVLGRIVWTEPQMVSTVGGMPKKKLRLGMMQGSDPYVILHHVDSMEVTIATPDHIAEWPWPAVDAFPGLAEFLRQHATINQTATNAPNEAWVCREWNA